MKKIVFLSLIILLIGAHHIMAQNRSGDALYSQMDDAYSNYDYAYSFEYAADPTYDSYGADDFEVPAGETWEIFSVKSIMSSSDAGATMNVFIYADSAGQPGAELHHFDNVTTNNVVTLPGYDKYEIETNLPSTVTLTEGVYWISIANEIYSTWDAGNWLYQATSTTILSPAHIINPGGGQGSWFPTEWTPEPWSSYKNLSFALFAPPVPNDLTVSGVISPVSGELTATETIEIAIANVGSEEQSAFDVQYQINDGTVVVESISDTILANETLNYVFNTTADMSALGDYTIVATVILAGDENPGNDSYEITVTNYGPIYELNATSTSDTTCGGLFTDAGGLFNGFESTDGGSITFYPETDGSRVSLDFTAFDFGYNTHHFVIYDGETTSDNILYTYVEDGYGYGEHNDPPTYIRARNEIGALTIELITHEYMYGADPGWVAEIGCMIPEDIDFTVLDMQLSDGFYHLDIPVQVTTHIVNSGATNQSRSVNLFADSTLISTATTDVLIPGEVGEITFTWYPQFTGNDISLSVEIEDDPGDTNEDNNLETLVDVYSQYALVESFEGGTVIPEYWDVIEGGFEKKNYGAYHDEYYLQNMYASPNSTLITPLLEVNEDDKLRFYAKGFEKDIDIIYSQDKNGPWEVLTSYTSALVSNWSYFETDLSSLADENYYYIGFAISNSGPYGGMFSIDMVTGPDKKFYNQNLDVDDVEVNQFPAIGREAKYSINVKNMGLESVAGSDFLLKLMVDSEDEEIASLEGKDIASFETESFDFYYEFSDDVASEIYFEIEFANDEDYSNNISNATPIYIQAEGTYDYFLEGDEDNPYPYDRYPIAASSSYSLSELIYYADEVQGTGDITGITLEYYATSASPYVPIKIWMGTTTETTLNDWITADSLELVYTGIVDFDSPSWEEMYIPLDSTFNYDGTENLLVMIDKGNSAVKGKVHFRTKDMNIYYKGILVTDNTNDIDPNNPDPSLYLQKFDHIPAMRFLIHSENALKFTTEPVTEAKKEVEYIYEVGVTNFQGGEITISEGAVFPDWLTLTQESRETTSATLSGTPEVLGDFDVQIYATDGEREITQTFTITVVPVLEFTSSPQTLVIAGENYTYNASVTYNGSAEVTFTEGIFFPDWLSIQDNGNNTATITGSTNEAGYYQVDIFATDGQVHTTQSYLVYVAAVPEFISDPVTLVAENVEYEYTAVVSYDGPFEVNFEEGDEFPEWLSILDNEDNTALISGITDQVGDHQVEIVAVGYLYQAKQNYTLTVGAVPEFTSEPVTVIDADQTYNYDITVSYNGNQPCEIIAGDDMPEWLTLTDHGNNTATLTGIPNELNSYDVDLVARGEYFDDTQSFTLDVMVGINEITNDMVHIYPNPVTNHFYITNMNTATIHIMDITGKIVSTLKVDSDNYKVNVDGYQNGLYIIRSSDKLFNINKKIIIK